MYHHSHSNYSSFSMAASFDDDQEMYCSSVDSVDCTLSLGTPSTRLQSDYDTTNHRQEKKRSSGFGWKIFSSSSSEKNNAPPTASRSHRGNSSSGGGDPLLARRCANCDTTSTPLWRNGPRGPKSLCNACGIRYKKEERRAMAAAAAANDAASGNHADSQYMMMSGSWATTTTTPQWPDTAAVPCYPPAVYGNEYQDDVVYHHDYDTASHHVY